MMINTLYQRVTPQVSGLEFRRFAGEADFPAMLNIIITCAKADGQDKVLTLESIERNYRYLVNSDPDKDLLMAEVNGEMIGYSRVWWQDVVEGQRLYCHFAYLVPEYRDSGVWPVMLAYNEYRLREIAGEHGSGEKEFDVWAEDNEKAWVALLKANDYQPIRYGFDMVREDPSTVKHYPLPDGLEVRPTSPGDYISIFDGAKEAFRDHWGFSEDHWSETSIQEWMEDPTFKPEFWQVAWDGDEVAGMILNYINEEENEQYARKRGYTETICVRRPWRRRGLARALLSRSIRMFDDLGMTETALGVDAQNPSGALQLYESMGYRVTKRAATYRKPLDGLIHSDKELQDETHP